MARDDDELPEIEVVAGDVDVRMEHVGEVVSGASPSRIQWVVGAGVAAVALIVATLAFRDDPPSPDERAQPDGTTPSTDPAGPADSGEADITPISVGEWWSFSSAFVVASDPQPFLVSLDEHRVLAIAEGLPDRFRAVGGHVAGEILYLDSPRQSVPIAESPLRWRTDAMVGWTGSEIIVTGGSNPDGIEIAGAAFDPEIGTWRQIADPPGFEPGSSDNRVLGPGAWTGEELISWQSQLAYNPTTDSWREVAPAPLAARTDEAVALTARGVLVWGGCAPSCDSPFRERFNDGAIYESSDDKWTVIADSPIDGGAGALVVDTTVNDRVVIVVPNPEEEIAVSVAAFDLSTLAWQAVEAPPAAAHANAVAWTGTHVLVWGIGTDDRPLSAALMTYSPNLDQWRSIPARSTTRDASAALWTRHGLLTVGGRLNGQPSIYKPYVDVPCPLQYDPRDGFDRITDELPEVGATTYENVAETVLESAQDIADRYPDMIDVTVGPGWGMAYEDIGTGVQVHRDLDDYSITVHFEEETHCTYPAPAFYPGPDGRSVPVRFVFESK